MTELLRLEEATVGYERPVLGPVNLSFLEGQRWAVIGPNGGGKSTLLKSACGLLPLLSGRRIFPGDKPRVGYVPQAHRADSLYPLTALEVAVQGRFSQLGLFRRPAKADWEKARACLDTVGLSAHHGSHFRALSGGQRQRVLLARALCTDPRLLFLDEFTSELDPVGTATLLGEVSRLTARSNVSVVFITHEVAAAARFATHVALVDGKQKLFETGPVEALLQTDSLTRLYGQPMRVERHAGRTVVHVESAESP
jgi:ABC-type Mn2+/Zn2+ transport system ATPase subunit